MITELDKSVTGVLTGVRVLPAQIGQNLLTELSRVQKAIDEEMLEEGVITFEYDDLQNNRVMLSMIVKQNFAFLGFSNCSNYRAVSHGYNFCITETNVIVGIDRRYQNTTVNHKLLQKCAAETQRALRMIEEARNLMKTHPAFKHIE